MEKGLGQSILEQINLAFWRKKKEDVVNNEVKIDGECLDCVDKSSEYWSSLTDRRRKGSEVSAKSNHSLSINAHGSGEESSNIPSSSNCIDAASCLSSDSGIQPISNPSNTVKSVVEQQPLIQGVVTDTKSTHSCDNNGAYQPLNETGGLEDVSTNEINFKAADQSIDTSKDFIACPDDKSSEVASKKKKIVRKKVVRPKSSCSDTPVRETVDKSSRALSPGVVSPLSFNSLHEKFQSLSRDSSAVDVPKRRLSKVNKLDTSQLAAVNEVRKVAPKEVTKVPPKINSQLQSRIMKFGEPSTVKIPNKKSEPSLRHSTIGGYAITENSTTSIVVAENKETATKKMKPKAPQPPGPEPQLPIERKVKKVKSKAPQPPEKVDDINTNTPISQQDSLSPCVELYCAPESVAEILKRNSPVLGNNNTGIVHNAEILTEHIPNIGKVAVYQPGCVADTQIGEQDWSIDYVKLSNQDTGINNSVLQEVPNDNTLVKIPLSIDSSSIRDGVDIPVLELDSSNLDIIGRTEQHYNMQEKKKMSSSDPHKEFHNNIHTCENSVPILSIPIKCNNSLDVNEDNFEDCETPKAVRKLLHLQDDEQTWTEMVRYQDDLRRFSRKSGGSSESESFHTPSPRPMYSSRGELLGEAGVPYTGEACALVPYPSIKEDWTPSPEDSRADSPISEFSDSSYDHYVTSVDVSLRSLSVPRRIFPQLNRPSSYHEDWNDDTSVVFDATLSFDLCSRRTPVRQLFRPSPAHSEPRTSSNDLSCRISEFLNRTDHIMDEWRRIGKSDPKDVLSLVELPQYRSNSTKRSKSAANIIIKGFQYYSPSRDSRSSSRRSHRSPSRYSQASDYTLADLEELNEVSCDLSDERVSLSQVTERLEAETVERMRLEQEVMQLSSHKQTLENTADRLEMELHYAIGSDATISDLEDFGEDISNVEVFKKKIERLKRENEHLRQRLRQQHEDDLEQLVALKKQLEKRLADAHEEVDEQRKVVTEWKKKTKKLQDELADSRILIQEEHSRNAYLEKKQRRFDTDKQNLEKILHDEKNLKEKIARERDAALGSKILVEQTLSSVRGDLMDKESEIKRLNQELNDFAASGATEHEVTLLKKAKLEMEKKVNELEAEVDELSGQLSLIEAAKLKLDLSLEVMRNEKRKELAQKEEEIDEVKSNCAMKLKTAEMNLESEIEERSQLARSKHELLRKLSEFEENERVRHAEDHDIITKLKRDLRKTKALLRDAQEMLDSTQEIPSKDALKSLKNQLEDAEINQKAAIKAKEKALFELEDVTKQLETMEILKNEADKRAQQAIRNAEDVKSQLEETDEDMTELLKKYEQLLADEQLRRTESDLALAELESERDSLRVKLNDALATIEASNRQEPIDPSQSCRRHESLISDLKKRREFDEAVQKRLEAQLVRAKENIERLNTQISTMARAETSLNEHVRKLQSSLRDVKEELNHLLGRMADLKLAKKEQEDRASELLKELQDERAKNRKAEERIFRMQAALTSSINDTDTEPSGEEDAEQ